jgi:hypothetical protein
MKISARVAPRNSVVLVEDSCGGQVPDSMNHSVVAATDSCIAVGCRAEDDGDTEITLGDALSVGTDEEPIFVGLVRTPSRKLSIRTVDEISLLEVSVPSAETRVSIWVNDRSEPDRIAIGFES